MEFTNTHEEATWMAMVAAALAGGRTGSMAVSDADCVLVDARARRGKEYRAAVQVMYAAQAAE